MPLGAKYPSYVSAHKFLGIAKEWRFGWLRIPWEKDWVLLFYLSVHWRSSHLGADKALSEQGCRSDVSSDPLPKYHLHGDCVPELSFPSSSPEANRVQIWHRNLTSAEDTLGRPWFSTAHMDWLAVTLGDNLFSISLRLFIVIMFEPSHQEDGSGTCFLEPEFRAMLCRCPKDSPPCTRGIIVYTPPWTSVRVWWRRCWCNDYASTMSAAHHILRIAY